MFVTCKLDGVDTVAAMGYWGTILMARSEHRLTKWLDIDYFGIRHRWLRDLGDGWQLLETHGLRTPLLREGARLLTEVTGAPVLAAYVSDSSCAAILATNPTGEAWSAHVPRPDKECRNYEHGFDVQPTGVDELCGDMTAWARGIGLVPGSAASIRDLLLYDRYAMKYDPAVEAMDAADVVFELLLALGLPEIPSSRPPRFDPAAPPFSLIASPVGGLGAIAHSEWLYHRAAERDGEAPEPMAEWVVEAAFLHDNIYSAQFEPRWTIEELVDRINHVRKLHAAALSKPPPATVEVGGQRVTSPRHLGEQLHSHLVDGSITPFRSNLDDYRYGRHPMPRSRPEPAAG